MPDTATLSALAFAAASLGAGCGYVAASLLTAAQRHDERTQIESDRALIRTLMSKLREFEKAAKKHKADCRKGQRAATLARALKKAAPKAGEQG